MLYKQILTYQVFTAHVDFFKNWRALAKEVRNHYIQIGKCYIKNGRRVPERHEKFASKR
jgi:hypothetical protein